MADCTASPNQAPGAIATPDGTMTAGGLRTEIRKIRGYPGTVELRTIPEILELQPGQVIGFSRLILPEEFATEFRISSISHNFDQGTSRIQFYIPQEEVITTPAADGTQPGGAIAAPGDPNQPPPQATGRYIIPCKGRTGDGIGPRSPSRMHRGLDIAAPYNAPIIAAQAGVVTYTLDGGGDGPNDHGKGWGNHIVIKHSDGNYTRYAHLKAGTLKVSKGQTVTQGQAIGGCGNSGRSYGPHLHYEIRKGSDMGTALAPSDVGEKPPGPYRGGYRY